MENSPTLSIQVHCGVWSIHVLLVALAGCTLLKHSLCGVSSTPVVDGSWSPDEGESSLKVRCAAGGVTVLGIFMPMFTNSLIV